MSARACAALAPHLAMRLLQLLHRLKVGHSGAVIRGAAELGVRLEARGRGRQGGVCASVGVARPRARRHAVRPLSGQLQHLLAVCKGTGPRDKAARRERGVRSGGGGGSRSRQTRPQGMRGATAGR